MAFKFFDWLMNKVSTTTSTGTFVEESLSTDYGIELYLREMAFYTCVRKIGTAISNCEFKTYKHTMENKVREVQSNEYWTWNYSPNPNQNKTQFIQKLIWQLYSNQESLIVDTGGYRYVADAYSRKDEAFNELNGYEYTNIQVGTAILPGKFYAKDVMVLRLEGPQVKTVLNGISEAEGKLIKSAYANYLKKNGRQGILNISDVAEQSTDFKSHYEDMINKTFKTYFSAENAVLPLWEGFSYDEKSSGETASSTDIRSMMNDIMNFTAVALGVPMSIVTGVNSKDSGQEFNNFITFTVQNITHMIEQEADRKIYGQTNVRNGNGLIIDTSSVKYTDLFSSAVAIDKLIASGGYSINDIRKRFGDAAIFEEWADKHWMTKNYSTMEQTLNGLNGDGNGSD